MTVCCWLRLASRALMSLSYLNLPKSMSLHTGGRAMGATSTRPRSTSPPSRLLRRAARLVRGEQGPKPPYRRQCVPLVRRLYRHDRDQVVVLQLQARPRGPAPELDRPDHVPRQVVAADHVAYPDPALVRL